LKLVIFEFLKKYFSKFEMSKVYSRHS